MLIKDENDELKPWVTIVVTVLEVVPGLYLDADIILARDPGTDSKNNVKVFACNFCVSG